MDIFVETSCRMCRCMQIPDYGHFTVDKHYVFEFVIDAENIIDDDGQKITVPESVFQSCFENLGEAVSFSFGPMFTDQTIYRVYLILREQNPDLEEIKVYSRIMHVNYVQAKRALTEKRNLMSCANAYNTAEILKKISHYHVNCETEPEFPYDIL